MIEWHIEKLETESGCDVSIGIESESDEPIHTRTRNSAISCKVPLSNEEDCDEILSDTGAVRCSKRLRGLEPEYNKSLDDSLDDVSELSKEKLFQGFCPRHGIVVKKAVIRDHNYTTEQLACYCPDENSTTTFDVAVRKVSEELDIAEQTLKYWVS